MNVNQLVRYQILHSETLLPVMRFDQFDGEYHEWFCYSVEDAIQGLEFVIDEWQDDEFLVALVCHPPVEQVDFGCNVTAWVCDCCGAMAEMYMRIRHYPNCNPVQWERANRRQGCNDPHCDYCNHEYPERFS